MRRLCLLVCCMWLAAGQEALTAPIVNGPFGDTIIVPPFGGWESQGIIETWTNAAGNIVVTGGVSPLAPPPLPPGFPQDYHIISSEPFVDEHLPKGIYTPPATDPSGRVYFTWDSGAILANDAVDLTIFLGLKNGNYAGDLGPMTGFNPTNGPSFEDEGSVSVAGQVFPYSSHLVLDVSELAASFPQFDMSDWVGGSGNVDVFTATVPFAALVPEPTVITLLSRPA